MVEVDLFPAEIISTASSPVHAALAALSPTSERAQKRSRPVSEDRSCRWHTRWLPWTTADPSLRLESSEGVADAASLKFGCGAPE